MDPVRSGRRPRRSAQELARAVESGRGVAAALRHLDAYGSEQDSTLVADALAFFLVARCESHHAGWRVLRQVVVDSSADAPWEKCARRAVPDVAADLLRLSGEGGRTPLTRAQHLAAQRRAEQIAAHVDARQLLRSLELPRRDVDPDLWVEALVEAVSARSREQVSRALVRVLGDP